MLPNDFLKRMQEMLGNEYPAFLDSYNEERTQALRLNPLKEGAMQFAAHAPFSLTPVPWEPNGFYYGTGDAPGKHPCHAAGVYYIQEASAMAPVRFLGARPGEHVLDLCAAPGGKSTQIAADMQGQGLLVSNEIHPARARILSENIERMGIRNAIVLNESPQSLAGLFAEYFDRILVDAPCSGEGMFRKNDSACAEWSPANVALCAARQLEILGCAATMLKPGGRMVYSTCTFAPEENEGTISRFLAQHPEFSIEEVPLAHGMSPADGSWVQEPAKGIERCIRLFPHRLRAEGHFIAVLHKDGALSPSHGVCSLGIEKGIAKKDCPEYPDFEKNSLARELSGKLLRFGEQLYLAPDELFGTRGLKVLRPGLHLGTIKKNRFEPGHALALALSPRAVCHVLELSSKSAEVQAYLNGQTLPAGGEKGWYLITVDGYSVGWGKLAGSVMKNHYPKGLRLPV